MALESLKKRLQLLKIEITDRYIQENFKRIEEAILSMYNDLTTINAKESTVIEKGNRNVDGGRADSIYTPEQKVDGGGA